MGSYSMAAVRGSMGVLGVASPWIVAELRVYELEGE
jgi:hypothetical protein